MRRALLAVPVVAWLALCPTAHADIGGETPSPGGCDYPAVGGFGAAFGEYDYACAFPTEINGSHHQTLFGGGMWSGTGGVSFMFINASVTTPIGALRGIAYWACPDLTVSAPPNPPGAWRNEIHPKPCKSIGPAPQLFPDEQEPPPEGPPPAPAAPDAVPLDQPAIPRATSPMQPQITNPENPNPDAAVRQGH